MMLKSHDNIPSITMHKGACGFTEQGPVISNVALMPILFFVVPVSTDLTKQIGQ